MYNTALTCHWHQLDTGLQDWPVCSPVAAQGVQAGQEGPPVPLAAPHYSTEAKPDDLFRP